MDIIQTSRQSRHNCLAVVIALATLFVPTVAWADPMCSHAFQGSVCLTFYLIIAVPFAAIYSALPVVWWGIRSQKMTRRALYLGTFGGIAIAVLSSLGAILLLWDHMGSIFPPLGDYSDISLLVPLGLVSAWLIAVDIRGRAEASQ